MKAAFLALGCALAGTAPLKAQTVELLNFWSNPSEQAALDVFADSYRQRGGEWYGTSRANEIQLKAYAIERIMDGYAPTAVQWHGGPDIPKLLDLGIIDPLDAVVEKRHLETFHPSVTAVLQRDGAIGALPVGLHGENWAWRSRSIYRELGLAPPASWEDFLRQAPAIREAGYRPLAVGASPWERALLFNTILIDIGGPDLYAAMIDRRLTPETHGEAIERGLHLLMRLRDEATSADHAYAGWSESTADVIAGRAAMQIMGDWAKGEFLNSGKVAGRDFDCALAPGNDAMSIVLDVFVFPGTDDAVIHAQQAALAEIVLDPVNQRRFSLIKGSLPVVSTVSMEGFDVCAKRGFALASDTSSNVPAMSLSLDQEHIAQVYGAIQTIWETPSMTPAAASALFFDRIGTP